MRLRARAPKAAAVDGDASSDSGEDADGSNFEAGSGSEDDNAEADGSDFEAEGEAALTTKATSKRATKQPPKQAKARAGACRAAVAARCARSNTNLASAAKPAAKKAAPKHPGAEAAAPKRGKKRSRTQFGAEELPDDYDDLEEEVDVPEGAPRRARHCKSFNPKAPLLCACFALQSTQTWVPA